MNLENQPAWLARPPRERLAKTLGIAAWIVTAAVLALVGLMRQIRIPLPEGVDLSFLPPFHAIVNALAAIVLVAALIAVRAGRLELHRRLMFSAIMLSVVFLLGYVAYHFTTDEVRFGDADLNGQVDAAELAAVGGMRTAYLVLLISHIVLAGVSLPFILLTFIAALTNRFESHRKLARWVFPIWLYVAATGPICYLMLRPYYP
jgi:putative membrane protein